LGAADLQPIRESINQQSRTTLAGYLVCSPNSHVPRLIDGS